LGFSSNRYPTEFQIQPYFWQLSAKVELKALVGAFANLLQGWRRTVTDTGEYFQF
jgi:hypothetical protein